MNQLLDLCLTLTPPDADAPEGTIVNVEVRCDALGLRPVAVRPLRDPFTPKERKELEWYLETYWQWPYETYAERGQRVEALLVEAGNRLYRAVFDQVQTVVTTWRLQSNVERQISIVSTVPTALSLPWELLHDEQGFLALRTKNPVSIIRRLPQIELGALPTTLAPPLRVLLVTARPDDAGFVDPRGIARELLDEVQPQIEAGAIALEFLRPPTLEALRERLSQSPPIHILHFDGHGTFPEGGRQGKLAFEDAERRARSRICRPPRGMASPDAPANCTRSNVGSCAAARLPFVASAAWAKRPPRAKPPTGWCAPECTLMPASFRLSTAATLACCSARWGIGWAWISIRARPQRRSGYCARP